MCSTSPRSTTEDVLLRMSVDVDLLLFFTIPRIATIASLRLLPFQRRYLHIQRKTMAANRVLPPISIWEKLDIIPAGFSIIIVIVYHLLTGLFRSKSGARTFRLHVLRGIVQQALTRLSSRQIQYAYLAQASKRTAVSMGG